MFLCFCINCFDSFTKCCLCKFCVFLVHTFVCCCGVVLQPFTMSPFLWPLVVETTTQFLIIVTTLYNFHLSHYFCFYPRMKVNGLNLEALCDFLDFIKYDDDKWVENFRMTKSSFFTLLTNCNVCCWNKTPIIKKLSLLKYKCHVWFISWPMVLIFWCVVNCL